MRPVLLVILDGWGNSARREGNAILLQGTPKLDRLAEQFPVSQLQTSGLAVGLPEGQMGNSEVGHTNIGAGRVVYQTWCGSTGPSSRASSSTTRCSAARCTRATAARCTCSAWSRTEACTARTRTSPRWWRWRAAKE